MADENCYMTPCYIVSQAVRVLLDVAPPESRMENWHSNTALTMSYASVAAFLLNLLQIIELKCSPFSISEPAEFMEACQGAILGQARPM